MPHSQGSIEWAAARLLKADALFREDQRSIHGRHQPAKVGILVEIKVHQNLLRHLAPEVEEPVRPTGAGDEELEVLADDLMKEPEDFDEVRLSGSVRTDEDVERAKLQGLIPDRLEASHSDAVETMHGRLL